LYYIASLASVSQSSHQEDNSEEKQNMARKLWLRTSVLALCGILTVAMVSQLAAETKNNIPANPKLSVEPPKDAVVLFGGKAEQMRDNWYTLRTTDPAGWTVDAEGVATPNRHDIRSKQEFGDCCLHVEFREPLEGGGNSGVGVQGRYEVQILNSFGKQPDAHGCGSFYSQTAPKVVASKPAGKWQTYDIFFRAPRFDADGKVVENARATVYQNGVLIHKNQEFKGPTGIQYDIFKGEEAKGPVVLQGDHDIVQFRNVWVLPAKY
jgi:hypothetical protein